MCQKSYSGHILARSSVINTSHIDRDRGMLYDGAMSYEIPLFPLNTVLFPGMPLTLHIFEERYRQMIDECVQKRQPFGVALIQSGVEALGPLAEPYSVGCTAEIVQVQTEEDGRLNILVIGHDRFRILSLRHDQPYLIGVVENFPLDESEPETDRASGRLRPWVIEYLSLLSEAGEMEFDPHQLPEEPEPLAFLAATLLQVPNQQKQSLLATTRAKTLLTDMRTLYRRELPLLRRMLHEEEQRPLGPGRFSLN